MTDDDPQPASYLWIEERELEAGERGVDWRTERGHRGRPLNRACSE
jgi:ribonuclease HI